MKTCIKKIYCAKCGQLVGCKEQKSNGGTKVACSKCGKTLYVWEGGSWRTVPDAA